jgi:hypothetical protein
MMEDQIMKISKMGLIILGICLCAGVAYAGPILVDTNPPPYQQTENSPCVIGNESCSQPAGFTYFGIGNTNLDPWIAYSPLYTVGDSSVVGVESGNIIPQEFWVGVDFNFAGGQDSETLDFFEVWIVSDINDYPGGFAGLGDIADADDVASGWPGYGSIDAANSSSSLAYTETTPGNGYSDIVLTGFSLSQGDIVYFRAGMTGDVSGFGQFFILPEQGSTPVPEPTTVILLGLGLAGIAGLSRKVRNK